MNRLVTSFRYKEDVRDCFWRWEKGKLWCEQYPEDIQDAETYTDAISILIDTGLFDKKFKKIIDGSEDLTE